MNHILIADADPDLCDLLAHYLHAEDFETTSVHDGEMAVKLALTHPCDALILDLVLPKLNGLAVIKEIRAHSTVPILVLSACHDDVERMLAFELGADDYVKKPCNPHEFIAHLRAVLRRSQKNPTTKQVIRYQHIVVDGPKRQVSVGGDLLELTNTEFNILEMLIRMPGQAFSKEELTEYALARKFTAYDRSIDVHISNLRNKLGHNASGEPWLKTVRGFGYMFNTD